MLRLLAWAIAGVMVATSAGATDGDILDDGPTRVGSVEIVKILLCDGKGAADAFCTELDLRSVIGSNVDLSAAPFWAVKFGNDTGCSGNVTAELRGSSYTPVDTGATESEPTIALGTITRAGSTNAISQPYPIGYRYLNARLGTMTACTDLEVIVEFQWPAGD